MAAKKKTAKKKASKKKSPGAGGAGMSGALGTVRFKKGFPRDIRDFINARFSGQPWHLDLRILDGDDGDGDDGDAQGPSIGSGSAGGMSGPAAKRKRSTPAKKKSARRRSRG